MMFTTDCVKDGSGRLYKHVANFWYICKITKMGAVEYFHRTVEAVDATRVVGCEPIQITTLGYIGD